MPDCYLAIISGERTGLVAMLVRAALRVASWPYRIATGLRNDYFNRIAMPTYLEAPVFSIGNFTVGGTGKTPMTIWLTKQLIARGNKPAVLSRGYKADDQGVADEIMLVTRHCPKAVAIANPDRSRAGQLAIADYDADAIVLDDGLQHRRVFRDLDIVLIDATQPFGYGYVLPRGLLRESLRGLRRAGAVVITRSDQVDDATFDAIRARIRDENASVPIVKAVHHPGEFIDLQCQPMALPVGRIGAFSGIARPEAFLSTLGGIGVKVADSLSWPDHHVYGDEDVQRLKQWVRDERLDVLVTTEKDAVKLSRLSTDWPVPIAVLPVQITFVDDGEAKLLNIIERTIQEYEEDNEYTNRIAEAEPRTD